MHLYSSTVRTLMPCTAARLVPRGVRAAAATHQQNSTLTRRPTVLLRHKTNICLYGLTSAHGEGRDMGCSDTSNGTGAMQAQNEPASAHQNVPRDVTGGQGSSHQGQEQQPGHTPTKRGASYYAGLLTTDLKVDNNSTSTDMLQRNLRLSGGAAAVLAVLVYLFMASNGLV